MGLVKGEWIPVPVFRSALERVLPEYAVDGYSASENFSKEAGMAEGGLRKLFERDFVSYNIVDKILANTHNINLWFEEPLKWYYDEPKIKVRHVSRCGCGKPKASHNVRCFRCRENETRRRAERARASGTTCACGGKKYIYSKTCWECYLTTVRVSGKVSA